MKRMRQTNKRRLLEYLIYWEIKEILYLSSFNPPEEEQKDLLWDLDEINDILKALAYTKDVEVVRIRFKNRYRSTYWKNLVLEDLILEDDLSNKFND
jgi:hypothetical protein